MPKYNEEVIELRKIITETPFDTLWVYWETDITFNIVGSSNSIVVRTPDKLLTNSYAYLNVGGTLSPLPLGTYTIGTYGFGVSCSYPNSAFDYQLVSGTIGYVKEVLFKSASIDVWQEVNIPNVGEEFIEWEAETNELQPYYNIKAPGDYTMGCSYSLLNRRNL
jgi:hypothetical protein